MLARCYDVASNVKSSKVGEGSFSDLLRTAVWLSCRRGLSTKTEAETRHVSKCLGFCVVWVDSQSVRKPSLSASVQTVQRVHVVEDCQTVYSSAAMSGRNVLGHGRPSFPSTLYIVKQMLTIFLRETE